MLEICCCHMQEIISEGKRTHKPSYDLSGVKIYLGINNSPLEDKDSFRINIYLSKLTCDSPSFLNRIYTAHYS